MRRKRKQRKTRERGQEADEETKMTTKWLSTLAFGGKRHPARPQGDRRGRDYCRSVLPTPPGHACRCLFCVVPSTLHSRTRTHARCRSVVRRVNQPRASHSINRPPERQPDHSIRPPSLAQSVWPSKYSLPPALKFLRFSHVSQSRVSSAFKGVCGPDRQRQRQRYATHAQCTGYGARHDAVPVLAVIAVSAAWNLGGSE